MSTRLRIIRPGAQLERSVPVFAALGDGTRLRVVVLLGDGGPASIASLTARTHLTRQAVTKHLRVLEAAGLVRSFRSGRQRVWELQPETLAEARRCLDRISAQWHQALGAFKPFVA